MPIFNDILSCKLLPLDIILSFMIPYINIHTHKSRNSTIQIFNSNFETIDSANNLKSVGLHPWKVMETDFDLFYHELKIACQHNSIVALGEIGIDRSIQTPIEKQMIVFTAQHVIAEQFNLPVIIHCVRAWSDLLAVRKELKTKLPWIFHGFTGSLQTANQLIKNGCYISFGKALTNQPNVQGVFIQLPLEFVFFETDDSDEKIESIYEKAANLRHICITELKEKMVENFTRIFGKVCKSIG